MKSLGVSFISALLPLSLYVPRLALSVLFKAGQSTLLIPQYQSEVLVSAAFYVDSCDLLNLLQ